MRYLTCGRTESEKGWNLSVWSRNVTNKLYSNNIVAVADAVVRYAGMPRTFGLSFGARFGGVIDRPERRTCVRQVSIA